MRRIKTGHKHAKTVGPSRKGERRKKKQERARQEWLKEKAKRAEEMKKLFDE